MPILSIQSHVVYGYAGNTAAVFPLQRLGHEVWAINTVEFSNHTGYRSWRGQILDSDIATELVSGVADRGRLSQCDAVLSGYLGDAKVAAAVQDAVNRVKTANTDALYCCDTVMGDVGRGFYVKPDIPDIFRNELVPIADIVTPNHFELEAIVGFPIITMSDTFSALEKLHKMGPRIICVTSFHANSADALIGMIVSDTKDIYFVETPKLPIDVGMAGSGDVTTALFLARYLSSRDIKYALEYSVSSIYHIIEKSWNYFKSDSSKPILMELRLIAEQSEIIEPSTIFRAQKLTIKKS
jgi:pyridoxine kinase